MTQMTTDDSKTTDERSLEERFLAGEAMEEPDDFDAELSELTSNRNRGSVLRPILMIIVILLVASVLHDWRDDLAYFFSSSQPVEVGDVAQFPVKMGEDPDWEPRITHNTYVAVEGMPTRMSGGSHYEVFRLIGGEIYVQRAVKDSEDEGDGDSLPARGLNPGLPIDDHRERYVGEGRLISFASDPTRVAGIKQFFEDRYNTRFCEDFTERQIEDLKHQRLETLRSNWGERYEQADEEDRLERGLTAQPTEAEEQAHLQRHPVCVDAYLLHDDQHPRDHWWYVLFATLLSLFVLYNCFQLITWFRKWLKP